jgi:hypothetical protein
MPKSPPNIEDLSRGFGALLPKSFEKLWSLASEVSPDDPKNAFDPIHLQWLGTEERIEDSYDTSPEFFTLGWSGCDSSRYGFIIDDLRHPPDEYPIAHSEPESQLLGNTLAEFLGSLFARAMEWQQPSGLIIDVGRMVELGLLPESTKIPPEEPAPPPSDLQRVHAAKIQDLWNRSQPVLGLHLPGDLEQVPALALQERVRAGAIATVDQIGAVVPDGSVDRNYLESLSWHGKQSWDRLPPNSSLLDEAERRLEIGEAGTALVIARNFRFLYWHDDWKRGRVFVRRRSEIMAEAYHCLGRDFHADRVRRQTATVLENVI